MVAMTTQPHPTTLHACRYGFEEVLCQEIVHADSTLVGQPYGPGLVGVDAAGWRGPLSIFERQRMLRPQGFLLDSLKPLTSELAESLLTPALQDEVPWAWHQVAFDVQDGSRVKRRMEGLERHARRWLSKTHSRVAKMERRNAEKLREGRYRVLQWWVTEDTLWVGGGTREELLDVKPGGVWRMKQDDAAPSRSFLKAEEAFARMDVEPGEGDRVVDLGAAPGGWTWACLRRGAEVWAIDNGPIKPTEAWDAFPRWHHLLENGLTWTAPAGQKVDWLLGDMLIPPGDAMGVLRRWLKRDDLKGLVFNVKLPQQNPIPAVLKLREFLDGWSDWDITIKQLYHDRREVTLMGTRT